MKKLLIAALALVTLSFIATPSYANDAIMDAIEATLRKVARLEKSAQENPTSAHEKLTNMKIMKNDLVNFTLNKKALTAAQQAKMHEIDAAIERVQQVVK